MLALELNPRRYTPVVAETPEEVQGLVPLEIARIRWLDGKEGMQGNRTTDPGGEFFLRRDFSDSWTVRHRRGGFHFLGGSRVCA